MTIKVEKTIHKVLIINKTTAIMNNCLTARIVLAGWLVTINQHNWIDRYIHTLIHTLTQIAWTDTLKLAARINNSANTLLRSLFRKDMSICWLTTFGPFRNNIIDNSTKESRVNSRLAICMFRLFKLILIEASEGGI